MNQENIVSVSGLVLECIQIAFHDYAKEVPEGFQKKLEYYYFKSSINDNGELFIKIGFDRQRILGQLNIRGIRGGGADYTLNLNTKQIINKIWHK